MAKKRGKLIVIDGIDKVGKETQTKLLVGRLKKEGYKSQAVHFPRYKENFFGAFVKECLLGKHGSFISLDPQIASVLYAADRFETKPFIEKHLKMGTHVVVDRYVSSNQIHQGGKIKNSKDRKKFLAWLDQLEYEKFGIPKPDVIIHLSLPMKLSHQLMEAVYGASNLPVRADTAELNLEYYQNSEKAARELARVQGWKVVDCSKRGEIRSIEDIHEEVWSLTRKVIA